MGEDVLQQAVFVLIRGVVAQHPFKDRHHRLNKVQIPRPLVVVVQQHWPEQGALRQLAIDVIRCRGVEPRAVAAGTGYIRQEFT